MLYAQRVFHFEVCKRGQYYYIDYGPYLESLEHVVGHYMNHADGLPVELQRPIKPPCPIKDENVVLKTVSQFFLLQVSITKRNCMQGSEEEPQSPTTAKQKFSPLSFT